MPNTEIRLEDLYEENFPKIYNYFFYHLLHKENAEDLTAATFLKVAENLKKYDANKAKCSTWLWKIAQNTLIDFYRTQKQTVSINDEASTELLNAYSTTFDEQYEQIAAPRRKALYAALLQLSESDRMLLYQKYFLGKSYREMGKEFKRGESTLATLVQRAKEKLQRLAVEAY